MSKLKASYQFLENTFSLVTLKGLDLVLALFLIPYLIAVVGIENYGRYAFGVAFILFFVNIANYGFELTTVRAIAKNQGNHKKLNQLVNEVFSVKLYLTGALLLLYIALIFSFSTFRSNSLFYLFFTIMLLADLFSLRWFFMGTEKMKFIALLNLIAGGIYIALVLLFVQKPEHFNRIIMLEGASFLVLNGIGFVMVVRNYKLKLTVLPFSFVYAYIVKQWSSFVNLFVPSMLSNTAVFLVGLFGLPTHVSIIQLAVKVANAFSTFNTILTKVFYSMVNRKIQLIRKSTAILLMVGVLGSVAMLISADFIIKPWLHIKDIETEQQLGFIIKMLSPTPLFMALISAYGVNGLLVLGKDKLFGQLTLATLVVGLLVGFLTIPTYTYLGGAIFLLVVRGLYAIGAFGFFNKKKLLKLKQKST